MLDTLPPVAKLALVAGAGWFLFKPKGEEGEQDPFEHVPGGAPGYDPGAAGPQYGQDGGAAPRRYEGGIPGAEQWDPDKDTIQVKLPPWWGVVGCCRAWATAGPSVRGAKAGGGPMVSPRSSAGKRCGCRPPDGGARSRTWFLPIEQAARRNTQPDCEVTPAQAEQYVLAGDGAGRIVEVRGFVHEGVAWVVSKQSRVWWPITDENPDVIYLVSTLGRCAYHKPSGRVLAPHAWRPQYKHKTIQASANPWDVDPWRAWAMGQQGGRGSAPLHADGNRVPVDFVGPPLLAAFLAKPIIVLPFTAKSSETKMKKPAKKASFKGKA